jgi:hypothetical protein
MVTETESKIESIDVANDDLIAVLASLVGGDDERLAVVGDGPRKMVMRTATTNVVEDTVLYASELVEDGEVTDEVEINGQAVEVQVL